MQQAKLKIGQYLVLFQRWLVERAAYLVPWQGRIKVNSGRRAELGTFGIFEIFQ